MSKTSFTIILTILIVAAGAGAFWFFSLYKIPSVAEPEPSENFLPFGEAPGAPPEIAPRTTGEAGGATGGETQIGGRKIRILSRAPVSGFAVINATTTLVRFIERATGHIYEIGADETTARRVTNTTIPRVQEAMFADGGNTVILRYLDDTGATIETYAAKIPKGGISGAEGGEIKGVFLPRNIETISVSPDGKKIFYIEKFSGGSIGFIAGTQNEGKTQVFNSPLTEWVSSWPEDKVVVLTTKPSQGITGRAYELTIATKKTEETISSPGLTTLTSSDGKTVLFGSSADSGLSLGIYKPKERTTLFFDNRTLPEKCVWVNGNVKIYCAVPRSLSGGLLPDSWYQGIVSFSDRIWLIDAVSGTSSLIADLERDTRGKIDATRLSVNKEGSFLIFTNKRDGSLWSVELP